MFETSYRLQLVHPEITYPNTKWAWYVFIEYITRKLIIELSIETKVKSGRFIIFKFEDITKKFSDHITGQLTPIISTREAAEMLMSLN